MRTHYNIGKNTEIILIGQPIFKQIVDLIEGINIRAQRALRQNRRIGDAARLVKKVEANGYSIGELRMFICKDDELSLTTQCELLGISKSGLYYTPKGESEENLNLIKLMDEHHTLQPTHGVLQMQDYLFSLGFLVNHKRVRRLMR